MKRFLAGFRVYELVLIALMAAMGLAIKPVVVPIAHMASGVLAMPGGAFAGGLYMMWLVIGYGLTRRPGTALLIALVQAVMVVVTGTVGSHGIFSLLTYLAPGMAMEILLLLIGHRVCCRSCALLAGAAANLAGTACVNALFFQAPGPYLVLVFSVAALSGAIGGLLAWELLRILHTWRLLPASRDEEKIKPTETPEETADTESMADPKSGANTASTGNTKNEERTKGT